MKHERRVVAPLAANAPTPYQAAFDANPVPQLMLRDGLVIAANVAATDALGVSREAVLGRAASVFLSSLDAPPGAGAAAVVVPSSPALPRTDAIITPVPRPGGGLDYLVSYPAAWARVALAKTDLSCGEPPSALRGRPKGRVRGPVAHQPQAPDPDLPPEVSAAPQAADAAAPRVDERLREMLAKLPLLWFRLDAAGVFRDAHAPPGMQLFAPPDAFLGRPLELVVPPELARISRAHLEQALTSDEPVHFDYALTINGKERWYQCHMARASAGDVFSYVTDVTARAMSQAAMRRAVEEARAAALARSRFVATVSHEVRTPINGILGMADLLNDTALDEEQASYVAMLRSAGRALLNVINDVLDFSKIEAGHLRLQATAFSPRDVVEGVLGLLAERAHVRGLEVGAWIAHDVPPTVIGDVTRVEQVLLNLVGNAIKFTPAGDVSVRLSVLHRTETGLRLLLEVVDSGVGIAPEVIPRLFAPFEQGDAVTTRRFGGTGLGLAICRRLADLMGGEISVESTVDVGSVFRFDLPVEVPEGARAPIPEPAPGLTAAGRPLSVIAFAPGARLREQLAYELPALGAMAWVTADWEAALARLATASRAGTAPNLFVVQLGFDPAVNAARAAALAKLAPGPRLVAVTAFGRRDQLPALHDAPFAEVLAAPLRLAELRGLLARAAAAAPI